MGFQNSTAGTALSEAYLDEEAKQSLLLYATAAARNADGALSTACREGIVSYQADTNSLKVQMDTTLANVSTVGPVHGAWTSYTPTWASLGTPVALGNGTITGSYIRLGRGIYYKIQLTMGSTTTYGTSTYTFTLPVATGEATYQHAGGFFALDSSASGLYSGAAFIGSSTTIQMHPASGTNIMTNLVPFTWANTDVLSVSGFYQASADA